MEHDSKIRILIAEDHRLFREGLRLILSNEGNFEIVGEALKRLREKDETAIDRIKGSRDAISFRNILAHGYDTIDNELVWGIVQKDLPELVDTLSAELKAQS